MRIIFNDDLKSIGNVQANEESFKEPKDVITLHSIQNFVFIFTDNVKSQYIGQMMNKLWPVFTSKNCTIVGLSEVYKTNYTTA